MARMATILSIETATGVCSAAVHQDGKLLGISELHIENAHGAKLLLLIDNLLSFLGLDPNVLDAVAVSAGPGSYTGLRIGVSTAKGICFANDIPLIGIDTLEALAFGVTRFAEADSCIVPMIDAKRNEIYTSVISGRGFVVKASHPLVVEGNPFLDLLERGKVYFLGDGLPKLAEVLGHPNSIFLECLNSADGMGGLAYRKFLAKDFADLAYFQPNYLKEFRVIASRKNPLVV